MSPELELDAQWHGGELFVWHAADLEDIKRTDDSTVAFAFTARWIDDRFECARFGFAARRFGRLGGEQSGMAAFAAQTLG